MYRRVSVGQRFGKLVTVGYEGGGKWRCLCDCGNTIIVTSGKLNGGQKGCNCIRGKNQGTHREAGPLVRTTEYRTWSGIIDRCENSTSKAFRWYGGRGIKVCPRWRSSYPAFLLDMGRKPSPKHSIDRINTNGDYEPSNCHWVLPVEQARNQRTNRLVAINGVTRCVAEWAEASGVPVKTLYNRVAQGWPVSELLSPVSQRKRMRDGYKRSRQVSCGELLEEG